MYCIMIMKTPIIPVRRRNISAGKPN